MNWFLGALAYAAVIAFLVREPRIKKTKKARPSKLALQVLVVAYTMSGGVLGTLMLTDEARLQYQKLSPPADPSAGETDWLLFGLMLGTASSIAVGVWGARKIT